MQPVLLLQITEDEYRTWLAQSIKDYAQDKVDAGTWQPGEALSRSEQDFTQLLPQGRVTPDNPIYSIQDATLGTHVGVLWIAVLSGGLRKTAYIYDIVIYEAYRRHGYGEGTMLALEEKVRELGLDTVGLHVFGHNKAAQALYEKVGYIVTDINMSKTLR
jgi:ribosomal protein S18 acetylase RimI-like enzyme